MSDSNESNAQAKLAWSAVIAFILSIGLLFVPIIGTIICYYVCFRSLHQIKASKGVLKGKPLVVAGIVITTAAFLFTLYVFVINGALR